MKLLLKLLYHFLGGVHFAILLIASVVIFVVAGTVLESITESHRYASYFTYSNPVFIALLWGFFINILFSALRRWPFQVHHIPFLMTHLGLLMILGGVLVKSYFGLQGTLSLIEGGGTHDVVIPYTYAIHVEKKGLTDIPKTVSANFSLERSWSGFVPNIRTDGEFANLQLELLEFIPNAKMHYDYELKKGQEYFIDGKPRTVAETSLIMYDRGFGGYAIQSKFIDNEDHIALETPLKVSFVNLPLSTRLEDNIPKITLKITDDETKKSEIISLPYERIAEGMKWPIIKGKYIVRFQPVVHQIQHHLRLRNARSVNYANSTQPYSYEGDLLITDLRNKNTIEKTISMNNVYETWDGFRFYLANITPSDERAVKKVQIAVNHDPGKYFLTYPGANILCLGVISLFWLRQRKTR